MNSSLALIRSQVCQLMDPTQKCNPCLRTSVTYVPGLYTEKRPCLLDRFGRILDTLSDMRSLVVSLWLAFGLSSGFAQESIDDFVGKLEKIIQSGKIDDLRKVTSSVPTERKILDVIFLSKGASLLRYELMSLDEAKARWPQLISKLIDSLEGVEKGDQILRMSWSKASENGDISIEHTFVVSKTGDDFKLRLELKK